MPIFRYLIAGLHLMLAFSVLAAGILLGPVALYWSRHAARQA